MFTPDQLSAMQSAIQSAQKIAIFSHENVDGDAVGCLLGFGTLLEKMGKTVGLYTTTTPGKAYSFLPTIGKIRIDFDYNDSWDLLVFVDFSEYSRIGKIIDGHEDYFNTKPKLIIDHHLGEDNYPHTVLLKDPDASSCAEVLYEISKNMYPDLLDAEIATYRYLGLTTDTGNFQYEKDSIRTMSNAIGLIQLGARKPWIVQNIFNGSDRSSIDLLKLIIPRIHHDGQVCYARYTVEEIRALGFDKDRADIMILSCLRPIKDIGVTAIIRKEATGNKVGLSLRSGFLANGGRIDVQKVAVAFGGGGHIYAAGCKVELEENFEAQIPKIVEKLNVEIKKQL